MSKDKQNVYRAMLHGLMELSDEFLIPQVPTTDGNWLYDVFFQLRLDHPEIFWATSFKYKFFKGSPNYIFIPEYIFEKNKIREHQKALKARVDKLARPAKNFSDIEKEKYVHDFICENVRYDKLKKAYDEVEKAYPRQCQAITDSLQELDFIELNACAAGCICSSLCCASSSSIRST